MKPNLPVKITDNPNDQWILDAIPTAIRNRITPRPIAVLRLKPIDRTDRPALDTGMLEANGS